MKNLQTVIREGFRARLFQAHKALEGREGQDLGREEIGKRVGKALGLKEPVSRDTVAAWFNRVLPPADVGAGLALVYGVRAGWLYFDEQPMHPDVAHGPMKTRKTGTMEKRPAPRTGRGTE